MNTNIIMMIEEGSRPSVKADAINKNLAQIYITAPSTQEALALLPAGEAAGREACQDWKPEPQPVEEKPQKHYRLYPVAVEDLQQFMDEYQKDEQGSKFVHSIQAAKDFTEKKNKGRGLRLGQMQYLAALAHLDLFEGLMAAYNVAYKRGYNKAKTERTAKKA